MLQTALNLPQGSGNGIGLSLDHPLQPTHAHWVYNRWPRFIYEFRGLEIRLQYYVTSQSVVQQYQIRNTTDEDIPLPYIISTDILFRDHELDSETFRPIPNQKTWERLMLSQNSELLVSDEPNDVQFEIAVFLNKQKISIWRDHQPSNGENEPNGNGDSEVVEMPFSVIEPWLRQTILNQKRIPSDEQISRQIYLWETPKRSPLDWRLKTYRRTNFAKFHNTLLVPRSSTQELCAIVKLTGPLQTETTLNQPATKPIRAQSKDLAMNGQSLSDHHQKTISTIRREEILLSRQGKEYSFDISDTKRKTQVIQHMEKRLFLGQALVNVGQAARARYYFFTGLLIAEVCHRDDVIVLSGIRFRYARFLLENGWYSDGLKKMLEDLVQSIPNEEGMAAKTTKLWSAVREELASIYLNLGRFSEAENLYQQCLQHLKQESSTLESRSASILERIAWAKVNQRQQHQYEEASEIYTRFLDQGSGRRRTLLSNLGFVKRKIGQFADAKEFYERAINEGSKSQSFDTDKIFAKSGLSSCLRSLRATPESIDRQAASSIKYIDINDTFSQLQYLLLPSKEHHPFDFVVLRHLEILLSVCSIPIKSNGVSGIMFLNADPVECAHEGRNAL